MLFISAYLKALQLPVLEYLHVAQLAGVVEAMT
jgi:hypothetical protein